MQLKERIQELSKAYLPEIIEIREHIHAHPELSFEEHETSKYIASQLDKMGVSYEKGIVKTGIVVLIKGNQPESNIRMLRADIDALPILEENDSAYCSKNKGIMHACGHDVHTASLLGAIKILHETRSEWKGTIKCIFQPGEEMLPGGASLMIKEGVLENPKPAYIIGQHVFPDLPAGKIGMRSGIYMASTDEIYIDILGVGGHAAMPHLNIDPILIASHVVIALQQIVSRRTNPEIPCVFSIGRIEGLGATNVIPNVVKMQGTFRTLNEEWRFKAHDLIREIAQDTAKAMGGSCEVEIRIGYPFLINDEELTLKSKEKAIEYLGADCVVDLPIRMTAEDFAYYSQEMPGCFYRLGTSSPDGKNQYPVHHSKFDIEPSALETGMGLMAWLAV